jgi:hypothetical protein
MKMVADANDFAARYDGAFVTMNASQDVAEIGITEGASGPSLHEFKLYHGADIWKALLAEFSRNRSFGARGLYEMHVHC